MRVSSILSGGVAALAAVATESDSDRTRRSPGRNVAARRLAAASKRRNWVPGAKRSVPQRTTNPPEYKWIALLAPHWGTLRFAPGTPTLPVSVRCCARLVILPPSVD